MISTRSRPQGAPVHYEIPVMLSWKANEWGVARQGQGACTAQLELKGEGE